MLDYSLNLGIIISVSIVGFLLSLNFAAITLLISVWLPRQIFSIFISLSILGFMFLYEESLTKIIPWIAKLSYLSIFHFYRSDDILIHNSFSIFNVIVLCLLFIIIVFVSLMSFSRKDILT